jgi:hypothetical protein
VIHTLLRQSGNRKRRVGATCRARDERTVHDEQIGMAEDFSEVVADSADDRAPERMRADQGIHETSQGRAVGLVEPIVSFRDCRSVFQSILRCARPEQIGGLCRLVVGEREPLGR